MLKLVVVMEGKKLIIACGIITAFALVCIGVVLFSMNRAPNGQKTTYSSITESGVLSCLPRKDTGDPQTLECAIGLHTEDGRYYALQDLPQDITAGSFNKHIQLTGLLVPPSPDAKYQIVGTIKVTENKIK